MPLVSKAFGDIITFTRASTGTYFDSTGTLQSAAIDVPRLDYNPATLAAQGLLIEEARTNFATYSAALNDPSWTKTRSSVVADQTSAPDGTTGADSLIEDNTASNTHFAQCNAVTPAATTAYTFTCFAKASSRTQCGVGLTGGGASDTIAIFDLSAGAYLGFSGAAPGAQSITAVGNGWYRCSVTFTTATTAAIAGRVHLATGGSISYTGDGTSSIFVWGAQLEAGAFPTSYIPTTTTALTRSADAASVNTLSPWFNSTAGTLFVQGIIAGGTAATFPRMSTLAGSNPNNDDMGVVWVANAGSMRWSVRAGGTTQADVTFVLPKSAGASFKVAGRYAANDFQAAFDGNLGVPDTTGTLPTITSLLLGGPASFQPGANVWLQRVTFYPRGLSNAELQAITA